MTVQYERDGGVWAARARVRGKDVVVQGRTLEAARAAMADEAAPLLRTHATNVAMRDAIALPDECTAAIADARAFRTAAAEAAARAQESLRFAARLLVHSHDLSYRDAAYALGVSHARIQQVLGKAAPNRKD
jgi:hypothetical protein